MDATMKPIRTVRCQVLRWETVRFRSEWTLLNIFLVDSGTDYFSTKRQQKPVFLARTLLTEQSAGHGCDNNTHSHSWDPSSRMRNFLLPISMNCFEKLLNKLPVPTSFLADINSAPPYEALQILSKALNSFFSTWYSASRRDLICLFLSHLPELDRIRQSHTEWKKTSRISVFF